MKQKRERRKEREEKMRNKLVSLLFKITLIIVAIVMFGLIIKDGLTATNEILDNAGCKTCSFFDDSCPEGYDTEENMRCLDIAEWPWKFAWAYRYFLIMLLGVLFAVLWSSRGHKEEKK